MGEQTIKKDYIIIEADNKSDLQEMIVECRRNGWQYVGGVSVTLSETDDHRYILYAQAMEKPIAPDRAYATNKADKPILLEVESKNGIPVYQLTKRERASYLLTSLLIE